jgi:hypothetical protein
LENDEGLPLLQGGEMSRRKSRKFLRFLGFLKVKKCPLKDGNASWWGATEAETEEILMAKGNLFRFFPCLPCSRRFPCFFPTGKAVRL